MKHNVTLIFADGRRLAAEVEHPEWPASLNAQDPRDGTFKHFVFNGASTFRESPPPMASVKEDTRGNH